MGTREHQGARQHLSVTADCHPPTSPHTTPASLVLLVNKHCSTVCSPPSYILISCLHVGISSSSHPTTSRPMPSFITTLSVASSLGPAAQETSHVATAYELGSCFLESQQQPNPGIKAVLSKPSAPSGCSKHLSPLVRHQVTFNNVTALIPRPKAIRFGNRFKNSYS